MRQTCHIDRPGVCSEEVRRPKAAPPPSCSDSLLRAWQQAFIGNGHPGGQNTCEKGYANWKSTDGAEDSSAGLRSHKFSGSQLTKVQTGLKDSLQVFSQDGTYVDWDLCYAIDDGLVEVSFAELIFRPWIVLRPGLNGACARQGVLDAIAAGAVVDGTAVTDAAYARGIQRQIAKHYYTTFRIGEKVWDSWRTLEGGITPLHYL